MTTQNKNVPALRFSEFDGDWEEKRLGEIGKFNSGTGFPEIAQGGKIGVPFYKVSDMNLDGNEFEMKVSNNYVTEEQIKTYKYKPIKQSSIIFAKVGAAIFLERKRIAKDFLIDNNMMSFTPTDNILFLKYLFETLYLSKFAQVGALPSYNSSDIGIIKIKLPLKTEQKKIATFLTAVDEKIQQLAKKKDLLEQYKKGVMQKIFNQEIRFKDSDGNDFANWEEKKFGDVITNKSEKYNPEKDKTNYKCIELEHLASETPGLLGCVNSINSGSIKNKFEKGDVLFGKLRPYLKKYLQAPFDGVCSSEIWVLKGKDILNDFLFRLVQTDEFISLANQSTGSKMPRADWNVISASLLAIPSKPEQQKIANFLSTIDVKINLVNRQLEKTKEYKKGLLQQMFV